MFKDFYTGQPISYAPWPPDRPYAGGFRYNCMELRVRRRGEGIGIRNSRSRIIVSRYSWRRRHKNFFPLRRPTFAMRNARLVKPAGSW